MISKPVKHTKVSNKQEQLTAAVWLHLLL